MSSIPLLAEGGGDGWIQIIVFVLIGLAAAIQWIVKWIASRGREKVEGEKPTPSLGDQVSREIRKYLGEIKPKEAPPAEPPTAPPPSPPPVIRRPEPVPAPAARPRLVRVRPKPKPRPAGEIDASWTPFDTREELRRAILAHEILGPPIALRGGRLRNPSRLTRR